jgi:hypothetical protein
VTSQAAPVAQDGPVRPQPSGQAAPGQTAAGRPGSGPDPRRPGQPAGTVTRLGAGMVAEPLPTGAWLRPEGASQAVDIYRGLLSRNLAGGVDLFRIVIGYPDAPAVPIHQIVELCRLITPKPAGSTRFARFGPVSGPASASAPGSMTGPGSRPGTSGDRPVPVRDLGQALADLMGQPVVVATGIRLLYPAAQGGVETRALLPEGAMTWLPYATDFGYQPRRSAAAIAVAPVALDAAAPIPGLAQTRPGTFALGGGKVLEVVQSGLWLRSDPEPANSAVVRALPPDPARPNLIYDTHASTGSERARRAARKVLRRLDERFRATVRIVPADQLDRHLAGHADRRGTLTMSDPSAPVVERSHTSAVLHPRPAGVQTEASAAQPGEVRREASAPNSAVPDHKGMTILFPEISTPDIPALGVPPFSVTVPAVPRTGPAHPSAAPGFLRESAPPAPPAADPDQGSATDPTGIPDRFPGAVAAHSTTPSKDRNPR